MKPTKAFSTNTVSRQPQQGIRTRPNRRKEEISFSHRKWRRADADLGQSIGRTRSVARLIADVCAGKVHPRIGAGLAPLMNLQLRAIETADFELRVAKLGKRVARAEEKLNRDAAAPGADAGHLRKPPRRA